MARIEADAADLWCPELVNMLARYAVWFVPGAGTTITVTIIT
jgi:hypothetical protein